MQMCKYYVAALLLVSSVPTMAQTDDFGLWSEVNVEKKLNKKWSLDAGLEYRNRDNMKTADRWSFGANVNYKLTDWLKLSAGYSLLDDHYYKLNDSGKKYADYWGLRHRFNVSATASKAFGNLTLSLRERWQYTYRPETTVQRYYTANDTEADEHTYSGKGKNVWRNRLQAKYKLSNMFRPYANVETYMSDGWDKIRYAAGTELRLNKQHSFDIKYMYQHPFSQDDTDANRHILGLGYTYKF